MALHSPDNPHFIRNDGAFLADTASPRRPSGHGSRYQDDDNVVFPDDDPSRLTAETASSNPGVPTERLANKICHQKIYSTIESYGTGVFANRTVPRSVIDQDRFMIGVEIESSCKSTDIKSQLSRGNILRSNWLYCRSDGSLDDDVGVEIITLPLGVNHSLDLKFWEGAYAYLRRFVYSVGSACNGQHIHVSRSFFRTPPGKECKILTPLAYSAVCWWLLCRVFPNFIADLFGRSPMHYCHAILAKNDTIDSKAELVKKLYGALPKKYHRDIDPLLPSFFDCENAPIRPEGFFKLYDHTSELNDSGSGTFEFRRGRGTLSPQETHARVLFIHALGNFSATHASDDAFLNPFGGFDASNPLIPRLAVALRQEAKRHHSLLLLRLIDYHFGPSAQTIVRPADATDPVRRVKARRA